MSSQESQPGNRSKESKPEAYVRAARFRGEHQSGQAYQTLQETILANQCDLSIYRLKQFEDVWFVAIIGAQPVSAIDDVAREILAAGEPASLPSDVLNALLARRLEATRRGPWVERHYRAQ